MYEQTPGFDLLSINYKIIFPVFSQLVLFLLNPDSKALEITTTLSVSLFTISWAKINIPYMTSKLNEKMEREKLGGTLCCHKITRNTPDIFVLIFLLMTGNRQWKLLQLQEIYS